MTNVEHLRKLLTTDEQIEFLESIKSDMDELKVELKDAGTELDDKYREIDRLEDEIEKEPDWETITTHLGTIEYKVEGSLALIQFMEGVKVSAIALHGGTISQ